MRFARALAAVTPAIVGWYVTRDPKYRARVKAGLGLAADIDLAQGSDVRLKIPARDVSLALEPPTGSSIQIMLAATVTSIEPTKRPAFQAVSLTVGTQALLAIVTRKAVGDLDLAPGRAVYALIKSATFHH